MTRGNPGQKRKPLSEETKTKIAKAHKGSVLSDETKRKIGKAHTGEKSRFWRGGVTPINKKIRGSFEYGLWRKSVFERDKYTCIWCGDDKGGNLEADHIKPFALYPELRFAIDNGRTLCHECHITTDDWGFKNKKHTEKTKLKMSEAHKGIKRGPHSEEAKLKISSAHKGKKHSKETKRKISLAMRGESRN